jgi:hypothetical protein
MKTRMIVAALILVTALSSCKSQDATPKSLKDMGSVDQLLAPIALYPDPLIAQILMSAQTPAKVTDLDKWLKANKSLKGSQLQDAAVKAGFEPSLVALALFPTVVAKMADQISWTTLVGQAFTSDKASVFDAIQRLRRQASDVGTLKTTPQQAVSTKKTSAGTDVIIIEPANPQIVYVPQYNPEVVYTQPPPAAPPPAAAPAPAQTTSSTTVVVVEDDDDDDAAMAVAAGMIGFTAGIAIGATMNSPYYYGPYGWHGGGYMYREAWDDYYDHREDAREDWMDHREDIVEERGDRAGDRQENVTDRRQNTQEQRTDRQQNRQENRPEGSQQRATGQRAEGATAQRAQGATAQRAEGATAQRAEGAGAQRAEAAGAQRAEGAAAQRSAGTERAAGERTGAASSAAAQSQRSTDRQGSAASRGYGQGTTSAGTQSAQRRSSSDAFSGYSSGSSQRASSARGQRSVSSSRGSSGGRSRGGRL